MPINKKLWTSSYVLLTVGIDVMMLSVLVFVIEIWKKQSWTYFFEVFGKNPLFIYILSGVFATLLFTFSIGETSAYSWIAQNVFMSWMGNRFGSLMFVLPVVKARTVNGKPLGQPMLYHLLLAMNNH